MAVYTRADPKHPQYPAGSEVEGVHVGGRWMPKGIGSIAFIQDAEAIRQELLNGRISDLTHPPVRGINAGYIRKARLASKREVFIKGTDVQHEMSAHWLNDVALGGLLPMLPTVQRGVQIDDISYDEPTESFVQPWMDETVAPNLRAWMRSAKQPLATIPDEQWKNLAMFDFIIGNEDRHNGNILVYGDRWLVPIDHGDGFVYQRTGYNYTLSRIHETLTGHGPEWQRFHRGDPPVDATRPFECQSCFETVGWRLTSHDRERLEHAKKALLTTDRRESHMEERWVSFLVRRINLLLNRDNISMSGEGWENMPGDR